jgi:hypothetical protein
MHRDDVFASLAFLVFVLIMGIEAIKYPIGKSLKFVGSGFFPVVLLSLLGALSGILFIVSLRNRLRIRSALWPQNLGPLAIIMSSILGYGIVLPIIGFWASTFLFTLVMFRYGYPERWLMPMVGAFISSAAALLVFEIWLKVQFPPGLLGF